MKVAEFIRIPPLAKVLEVGHVMTSLSATLERPLPALPPGNKLDAATAAIRARWSCDATTAIILGTGLGELADEVAASAVLPYRDVPGFARSTALAHKGRLVCGELAGSPVMMLQGRCHGYEGYSFEELTFPVRVLAALGIKNLVVTNAAGGLNPNYAIGEVMLIDDHINLMDFPRCRLVEDDAEDWQAEVVSRSPPVSRFYDPELADSAASAARRADFVLHRGV